MKRKPGRWFVVNTDLGAEIREALDAECCGIQMSRLVCQMAFMRTKSGIAEQRSRARSICLLINADNDKTGNGQ